MGRGVSPGGVEGVGGVDGGGEDRAEADAQEKERSFVVLRR